MLLLLRLHYSTYCTHTYKDGSSDYGVGRAAPRPPYQAANADVYAQSCSQFMPIRRPNCTLPWATPVDEVSGASLTRAA
jgi:hypothetical protein